MAGTDINSQILNSVTVADNNYKNQMNATVNGQTHFNLGPIHIPKLFGIGVDKNAVQNAQQQYQQMQQMAFEIQNGIEQTIQKVIAGSYDKNQ